MGPRATVLAAVLTIALGTGQGAGAQANDPSDAMLEPMPPRLSLTDGQVSFWRPGAQDWTQAQLNTPLAPGDALATGSPGTLEVQIGAHAFVRAWGNTQLSLANQEPDLIQFTLTVGSAVIDLRTLEPGQTVEVDTPNAAVTMAHAGYYRVEVAGERSRVVTRRGGLARVTTASGQTVTVTPSDEVVIEGTASPQLAVAAAPPLDEWDRWNDTRTEGFVHAASARYVSPGTYGLSDLDAHGTWRAVPTYGTVWVPTSVPVGWTPYSTGSWILDPVYGWTWVDTAPWGWAPYHHGRWCFVNGSWAWAPGPVIQRPVYAPALVAFLDEPSRGAVSGPGGPAVGWVALGWGEPVVPWWGRWRVAREPSWRGWGGPRVVNNVVIHRKTVVSVHHISVYRNASVPHAVVAVDRTRFGHGPTALSRVLHVDGQRMRPVHGAPQISATAASFAPTAIRGIRPPEESLKRPVVVPRSLPRESQRRFDRAQAAAAGASPIPARDRSNAPSGIRSHRPRRRGRTGSRWLRCVRARWTFHGRRSGRAGRFRRTRGWAKDRQHCCPHQVPRIDAGRHWSAVRCHRKLETGQVEGRRRLAPSARRDRRIEGSKSRPCLIRCGSRPGSGQAPGPESRATLAFRPVELSTGRRRPASPRRHCPEGPPIVSHRGGSRRVRRHRLEQRVINARRDPGPR